MRSVIVDPTAKATMKMVLSKVCTSLRVQLGDMTQHYNFDELYTNLTDQIQLIHANTINIYRDYFQQLFEQIEDRDFYTLISSHSSTQKSISELSIREFMGLSKGITHLLSAENIRSDEDAKKLMGRILFDRSVAKFAFQSVDSYRVALSTPIDLMADATRQAISAKPTPASKAGKCPFAFFAAHTNVANPHIIDEKIKPPEKGH